MYSVNWGEVGLERFLAEYWQRKPCLFRAALAEIQPLVEPDELAGLALESEVESRLIINDTNSKTYSLERGPLEETRFSELPEQNWTLLIQALDHYVPEAKALLDSFNFVPRWRVDDLMVSYATPGGGVGPHYDNYDVFLIQAGGSRRWELGEFEGSDSPRIENAPVLLLKEFTPSAHFDLEPGDMLYIPPRLAHNGVATSADCVTYSVGFRAPSISDLLQGVAQRAADQLTEEDRYTDPLPPRQDRPNEITSVHLTQVKSYLKTMIEDEQLLADWLGSYASDPKYGDPDDLPTDDEVEDWLNEGTWIEGVSLMLDARVCYGRTPQALRLYANGEVLKIDNSDVDWVLKLADQRETDRLADTPATRTLLTKLARLGVISIDDQLY